MAGPNHLRLLYHFTSEANTRAILDSGEIAVSGRPPGSNGSGPEALGSAASGSAALGSKRFGSKGSASERGLARVVWLTDDADPGIGDDHGLGRLGGTEFGADKRAVRFTVSVPDAQHWPEWAHRRRVSRRLLRQLDEAGGGLSERWWVVPRAIATAEWTFVEDLRTGELIWPLADTHQRVPILI
jgi:hypothetical protein